MVHEDRISRTTVSPKEGARIPLVCLTCGAVHQPGNKSPQETCGTLIKFLTCSVSAHHLTAYTPVSGWKLGEPCSQSTYGCKGTLLDSGVTRPCPGKLTEQTLKLP